MLTDKLILALAATVLALTIAERPPAARFLDALYVVPAVNAEDGPT
jgi:hypothetical protein